MVPETILTKRITRHKNKPVVQVLINWLNAAKEVFNLGGL
jgi:hypothetical protein